MVHRLWSDKNKNIHPTHGTDVISVVPPNLSCICALLGLSASLIESGSLLVTLSTSRYMTLP